MGRGKPFHGENQLFKLLEGGFLVLLALRSTTEAFSGLGVVVGPWVVNPSVTLMLLMDAIGALYLFALWRKGAWQLDRLGLFFLLWALSLGPWVYGAAALWGPAGLAGVREWFRLLSLVVVYLMARAVAERRGPEPVLTACLLALPIPLVATYWQAFTDPAARAAGMMVHPNNLAAFLVVMVGLTLWQLGRPTLSRTARLLWVGVLLLELGALIPPVSSNGWLMFGIFLAVYALFSPGWKLKAAGLVAGLLFLALFGLLFLQDGRLQREVWQNLGDLGLPTPQEETLREGTLAWRVKMWQGLIEAWRERPWLGYGLQSVPWLNPLIGKAAHNDYVRFLVEGGVAGLGLFALLILLVGGELLRRWHRAPTLEARRALAVALGGWAAWAVGSFGDNVIGMTVFHIYLWSGFAALSVAGFVSFLGNPSASFAARRAVLENAVGGALRRPPAPSFAEAWAAWRARGWEALRSRPRGWGEGTPLCRRCLKASWTSGALLCRRCLRPLVGFGWLAALVLLVWAAVGMMGLYLWSKGAEMETFWAGWLLGAAFVLLLLRNERRGLLWAPPVLLFVGVLLLAWLYRPPALRGLMDEVALAGLGLMTLGSLVSSGWAVGGARSIPAILGTLSLLSAGLLALGPQWGLPLPPAVFLPWLEGAPLETSLSLVPLGLGIGAVVGLLMGAGGRLVSGWRRYAWPSRLAVLREIPLALLEALEEFIVLLLRWVRVWVGPLGALFGLAWVTDAALREVSAFLYGDPVGFGRALLLLSGGYILLCVFFWGFAQRDLRAVLVDVGLAYLFWLVLIQTGAWLASGALWGLAQLLPLFPETRRFAPLLHARSLGLYTWYSLGIFTGVLLWGFFDFLRRRLHRR